MNFKFTKYKINDVSYPLHESIKVNAADLGLILNDMLTLDQLLNINSIESSFIGINITSEDKNEDIEIFKDYKSKKIGFNSNLSQITQDIYSYISQKYSFNFYKDLLKERIIDFKVINLANFTSLTEYISKLDSKIQAQTNQQSNPQVDQNNFEAKLEELKKQAAEGLTPDELTKVERLREVKMKIKDLQDQVDQYQSSKKSKDDLTNIIKKTEQDIKNLDDKIESVKLLIDNREEIKTEINKFDRNFMADPALPGKVKDLKETRKNKVFTSLMNIRSASRSIINNGNKSVSRYFFGKSIILLIFLEIVLTIGLYVLSFQDKVIFLGTAGVILLSIIFLLLNLSKNDVDLYTDLDKNVRKIAYDDLVKSNNNAEQDKLFVNSAWLAALNKELSLVDQIIRTRLNNKSPEDLRREKIELEENFSKLKTDLASLDKKVMTSEEYYKKRRELDILKIEKENLEYTVKGGDEEIEKQIIEISLKLNESVNQQEGNQEKFMLPLILINLSHALPEIIEGLKKIVIQRQVIIFELIS